MSRTPITEIPERYRQPDDRFEGRVLTQNKKEIIKFIPQSHIRIWYNIQTEGYPLHSHEAFEAIICVQNTYTIHVNTEKYTLREGDILIISPNTLHEFINDSYGVRFIYLIETNEFYRSRDYKSIEPLFFNAFLCNKKTCPDIYEQVYGLFMEMNDAYFERHCFWETIIFSKFYQVFTRIAQHAEKAVAIEGSDTSVSVNRIRNLMHYVDINYPEDITTEQAAQITGFSRYHFLRLFKLQTGYTFHDYLILKRVTVAGNLLGDDTSVTDVAFRIGFNSLPSFCRAFKKHTGYSPSEFRKLRLAGERDPRSLTLNTTQGNAGDDVF